MMPWDMMTTVTDYWNYKLRNPGENITKTEDGEDDLNK